MRPVWSPESFFATKTIEQLLSEQGIQPISDISSLSGAIPDEDVDDFIADMRRGRD
ncbi:MAG: hypothetical protein ABI824_10405 [Acidobacteriota bacterium]